MLLSVRSRCKRDGLGEDYRVPSIESTRGCGFCNIGWAKRCSAGVRLGMVPLRVV